MSRSRRPRRGASSGPASLVAAGALALLGASCSRNDAADSETGTRPEPGDSPTATALQAKLGAALEMAAQNKPSTDELLDQYEQVVTRFEALGGPISSDDMREIGQATVDYPQRIQEWQDAGVLMSGAQSRRLSDLQSRLAHVLERASGQPEG